jgi:hypothetical protein
VEGSVNACLGANESGANPRIQQGAMMIKARDARLTVSFMVEIDGGRELSV